ncbi:MAG: ATP-binding protein [Myxococcota bacterium]|nr:ATP-binding protein [Myxococcota bacterium]
MEGRTAELEHRLELLLEVATRIAAATTLDEVSRSVIDTGVAALGASGAGLWLLDRDGDVLRLLGASPPELAADRWATVPLASELPLAQVVRTNQPVVIDSLADYRARYPASFERIRDTVTSPEVTYALVPVAADDALLGALAVTYDRAGAVDAADRTYLRLLARQCGLALARIRLADAERLARIQAEQATAAHDEILAVVSHDLRNPLGTILMGSSTLLGVFTAADDPKQARLRAIVERIQRQSERMARLIDDLVDFSSIHAGPLALERQAQRPEAVIDGARERFGPIAVERGIELAIDVAPNLPAVELDHDRAVQALSSLIGNALKVTTKGGRIEVGATDAAGEVVFYVRDAGPGIEPSELPRIFERSWRSTRSAYRGAALGFTIARGIVDAHGGRIWADSHVGSGAAFYFTLGRG